MAKQEETEIALDTQSPAAKPLELYVLEIELKSASNLVAADLNGKSDPFLKVLANGQSYSTKTIEKTLNPVFNERTQFCFFEPLNEIKFEVWDWDQSFKNDKIGTCSLNTSNFFQSGNKGFSGDINLQGVKSGKINVTVKGRYINPIELEKRCDDLQLQAKSNEQMIVKNEQELKEVNIYNQELKKNNQQYKITEQELTENITVLKKQINVAEETNENLQNDLIDLQGQIGNTKDEIEKNQK